MEAPASVVRGGIAGLVLLLTLAAAALLLFVPGPAAAQSDTTDYDVDNDGLIDIDRLAKLNAIRWDLNGDGQVASADQEKYDAAFPSAAAGMGCPSIDHDGDATTDDQPVCTGYELTANLTFDSNTDNVIDSADAAYWNDGAGWVPIITFRGKSKIAYSAIFEGNGHTIDYLFINREYHNYVGLFGELSTSGHIRNLNLTHVNVTGNNLVGGLLGRNAYGVVSGAAVSGTVTGDNGVGGLVGENGCRWCGSNDSATIERSSSSGSVTGDWCVGGLVGCNESEIKYSFSDAAVKADELVGGLVGRNHSRAGRQATISGSYASGAVLCTDWHTGDDAAAGGLVGRNLQGSHISNSYATGPVRGRRAGGLVGENSDSQIRDSYAAGAVIGKRYAGGLIGVHRQGSVLRTYSSGVLVKDIYPWDWDIRIHVGGLLGDLRSGDSGKSKDNYWDTIASGYTTSGMGQGYTTTQLQTPTGYNGIYASWHVDADNADGDNDPASGKDDLWDFGTSSQYPALKADWDGDGTPTAAEFGNQGPAAVQNAATAVAKISGWKPIELKIAPEPVDYDTDDDGLIEVDSLAKLNALRWDHTGHGEAVSESITRFHPSVREMLASYYAAFPNPLPGLGCPTDDTTDADGDGDDKDATDDSDKLDCIGYELTKNLDFDQNEDGRITSADPYWNDGEGWEPIRGYFDDEFHTIFDGNGFTISNLFINRKSNDVGLFGQTG